YGRALTIVCRRLGREWLRRARLLAGHRGLLDRPLINWPNRLSGYAIEDIEKRLLGWLRDSFDGAAIDRYVCQDRRAGNVHVPNTVVNELVVPLSLAGVEIDRDQ